mmetsp:Transcript_21776/g.32277  ORF Transcript_21776/g.32277 Transcript_21776/m.32277 type:complete len:128 (-) Transcript_21776:31-414(-)
MPFTITKAITAVSSIHRVKVAFRDVFYSPTHFPKILATTMLFSCFGGYQIMDSIQLRRIEEQEQQYSSAWETYRNGRERYNEQYETALSPSSLQKRRITKSESVVFISRETKRRIDETRDRLRIIQE